MFVNNDEEEEDVANENKLLRNLSIEFLLKSN